LIAPAVPPGPPRSSCPGGVQRRHRATVALAALALLALLAGCASGGATVPPAPPEPGQIAAREQRLAGLERYSVGGSFAYRDERQYLGAALDWRRDGDALAVSLRAPLGLGRLEVRQDARGARVVRSGREALTGPSAAPLLRTALGLSAPVPLDQLGDWIRGLPGSAASGVERDEAGRLRTLVYRDGTGQRWRTTVRRYREVNGLWLPALLTAVSGERRLRLALVDWRVPGPSAEPVPDRAPVESPGRRLSLPGG